DQLRRRPRHAPVPCDLARRPRRASGFGRLGSRRIEPVTGAGQEATGTPRPSGREPIDSDRPSSGPGADLGLDPAPPGAIDLTRFAHASEAEMARILDFY